MYFIKLSLLLLLMGNPFFTFCQQLWGVVNSNYAGINSNLINPAFMSDSKCFLDINLLTFDLSASNNMLAIPKDEVGFFEMFNLNANFMEHHERPIIDFTDSRDRAKAFVSNRIELPSIMLNLQPNAFAFHWSLRSELSLKGLDHRSTKLAIEGLGYDPLQNQWIDVKNIKVAALSWAEFGFSYSRIIQQISNQYWSAGLTFKYLKGLGGAYLEVPNARYRIPNDSTIEIANIQGQFASSLPLDYQNNDFYLSNGLFSGSGIALDLGIMYQKKRDGNGLQRYQRPCSQKWEPYYYKLGISLLDFGFVNLKDNTLANDFPNSTAYWVGAQRFNPDNMNELNLELAQQLQSAITNPEKVKMGLPTAISLQCDINPIGYWYYNFSIIQALPIFKHSLIRPTQVAFVPRYERRYFEVNIPFSMYDWQALRAGIVVRILNFSIGTDDFLQFTGWKNFNGFNIYFSWKKSFYKGNCKKGNSHFHRGKRFYQNVCPAF